MKIDRIIGLIGIMLSLFFIYSLKNTALETNLETKLFPICCLFLLFILSVIIIFRNGGIEQYHFKNFNKVIFNFFLIILYIFLLKYINFTFSSILYLVAFLFLNKYNGKYLYGSFYCIGLPLLLYGVFSIVFKVSLP